MKIFDDKSFRILEKALDLRMKRHAVITSNLANTETPGYRAREVDFAGELQRALGAPEELKKTNEKHMDITGASQAHVILDPTSAVGSDGNNVDLDITMGKLSANAQGYNHAVNLFTMKLRMLRDAATGRGM